MKKIHLNGPNARGRYALVDAMDYEYLNTFRWHCSMKGDGAYACTRMSGGHVLMQHLLLERKAGQSIDHINRNRLDNRHVNIRLCSYAENNRNRSSNKGKSIYKGVHWIESRKKWCARIAADSRRILIGYFSDEREAASAYDSHAKVLHGNFSVLNFKS